MCLSLVLLLEDLANIEVKEYQQTYYYGNEPLFS